jgi:hypothetical protein
MEGIKVLPTRPSQDAAPTPSAPKPEGLVSPLMAKSTSLSPRVSPTPRWTRVTSRSSANRFSKPRSSAPRSSAPRSSGKFVISQEQLDREACIKGTVNESLKGFISTVTRVRIVDGKKSMWTTLPAGMQALYGCYEMLTVHGWKQTERGNVVTDISAYKVEHKVKMVVQSVGCGGRNARRPLIRGIPDPDQEEQKHTLVTDSESTRASLRPSLKTRQSARNTLSKATNARPSGLAATMRRSGNVPFRRIASARASSQQAPMTGGRFPRPSQGYSLDGAFRMASGLRNSSSRFSRGNF